MRKHILILLMLLCSSLAFGQNKTLYAWARTTDTAYTSGSWRLDSVMRALYYATNDTNKVLGINAQGYIVLRTKTTGGGGSTDTTSLSNRIDARVKYTDTAAMLLPYARKTLVADTAAAIRASIPSVTGKVNYTDTAAMLSPYYRTAVATVALAAKQAYADTTTWDATKKNLADTAAVLRGLIPTGVDTTSLSNRIDLRVKYTDTAAMLSPYLRSALAATTYVPYTGATSNVNLGTYNLIADAVQFNTTPSISASQGLTYWDAAEATLATTLDVTNGVTLQHGQEMYVRAVNKTGVTITDGQVVYISGAQGNRPKMTLAQADSISTSLVIGVATQNIADNAEGFVTTVGVVNGFNTSGFTAGDELFLSATSAGVLTNVPPSSPNNSAAVGIALNSTINGAIYVHPQQTLSGDTTFTDNSNRIGSTQKAVKAYVDKRVRYTDTATMLSPYLRDADTTAMLSPYYRTATATAALALKANIASPTFTGTVTTPALTISSLTAGSTSDSVVTVNAATGVLYRRAFPSSGGGSGWSLTGNAGTTAGTNYVGTTDAQDLYLKANNKTFIIGSQNHGVAVGLGASVTGTVSPIAIGYGAYSQGTGGIAIGTDARSEATFTIAIGSNARPQHQDAMVLAGNYGTGSFSDAANQFKAVFPAGMKFNTASGTNVVSVAVDAGKAMSVTSTTGGFVFPVMTDAQKGAIPSLTAGVSVYCSDCTATDASTGVVQTYNGTTWKNHW